MTLDRFNRASRGFLAEELRRGTFDVLVIGGGITGASIFRDAVLRGMRVALLEARDFASGTSSRSSKLIHGGLRYLSSLGVLLARESCRERNLHLRLNGRLVRPLAFVAPSYRGVSDPDWLVRAGLMAYEVLSGFRNHRLHRHLTRGEVLAMAPGVPADGLTGGWRYYDASVSDNRWTLETIKDGVRHGGIALNYAPVNELLKAHNQIHGAAFRDEVTGEVGHVQARTTINATGVFADAVRRLDEGNAAPLVRLSKGTHLVFRDQDVPLSVTTVFRSPLDRRHLFLLKHEGCFVYGTTDDWEEGDAKNPAPAPKDVGYLLDSLHAFMPEAGLDADKVQFVYSGFRPLVAREARPARPSEASREDLIEESASGLTTVVGGKLTTARLIASRVLDRVIARVPGGWGPCVTAEQSLGGTNLAVAEGLAKWAKRCPKLTGHFRKLYDRYGTDADRICERALRLYRAGDPTGLGPELDPMRSEVEYVCRHEMACTVEDLLDRRAGFLDWNPTTRLEKLRYAAEIIRAELGLGKDEFEQQVEAYRLHLQRFHTLPRSAAPQKGG